MKLHRWLQLNVKPVVDLCTPTNVVVLLEDRHIMKRHHKNDIMYDHV